MHQLGKKSVEPIKPVDLAGQTALVTGASAGLGRRFSLLLARAGAKVAMVARREDRLAEVAAEIRALGGEALPLRLDVADIDAMTAAVARAERELGPVQILVNNAGIGIGKPTTELSRAEIDLLFNVNLRGPLFLAREVAARLIALKLPGRIVNISSIGAFVHTGASDSQIYSITKAAVTRMTEVHALEWAIHGINVNAIAPGYIRTELVDNMDQAKVATVVAGMRRGRIGEPHHLDSTLLYLVDPASEFVTGTCIKADDAQMAR